MSSTRLPGSRRLTPPPSTIVGIGRPGKPSRPACRDLTCYRTEAAALAPGKGKRAGGVAWWCPEHGAFHVERKSAP